MVGHGVAHLRQVTGGDPSGRVGLALGLAMPVVIPPGVGMDGE
jgi:hypothetical protein